jgi:hypothetical protein
MKPPDDYNHKAFYMTGWHNYMYSENTGRPRGGRIILKLIIKKWDGRVWTRFMWLRIVTIGTSL